MKSWNPSGKTWVAAAATLLVVAGASTSHAAATNTKGEVGCYSALAKAVSKHVSAVSKAMATCQNAVINGDIVGPCPDATAQAAIDKSTASVLKSVESKCHSSCSVSGVDCIDNLTCPPNGASPEACTAGGKNNFQATRMGFPGPFCEAIIGGPMIDTATFATCMSGLGDVVADELFDNIYGDLDDSSTLTADGAKCLAGIIKAAPKSAGKLAGTVSKCRAAQLGADPATIQPDNCETADAKVSAKVASDTQKFLDAIDKSCDDAQIQELDICGAGVGGVSTVAAAQACLGDLLYETALSIEDAEDKDLAGTSIINAVYPGTTAARCGDNLVNQLPSQFFPVGEECDGTDDSDCPGACGEPGDLFQCTCLTTLRVRTLADGFAADLDNGWSGNSHNAAVTDGAGFLSVTTNCDCDEFDATDKATCIGTTSDQVCDTLATLEPRCSNKLDTGNSCDEEGDNGGSNTDADCQACDDFSVNAGDFCDDEADCQSQCFDANGVVQGLCDRQSDCAEGQFCRGRCDKTGYCLKLRNGAPLPLSAAGTSVCIDSQFFTNAVGTRNIVTGEHAVNYELRSVTHLAQSLARPCPACGGWCEAPSQLRGEICDGSCSGPERECRAGANIGNPCTMDAECPDSTCHNVRCRFDEDCATGTCEQASPECAGENCVLDLICAGGMNDGDPCRIEAYTAFGTTSADCPPPIGLNISGGGLAISWTPLTSEPVSLENGGACDAPGYENFDCFCATGGGTTRTQPNRCAEACDAGPNYGEPCGGFTECVGGSEAGAACDEDSDCSGGGTCSSNPGTCNGGSNPGAACNVATAGVDCPGGTCDDICPGGRCNQLCVVKGECNGGANDGRLCGLDADCPGGTCDVIPPGHEGVCAAGPSFNHCDGPGQTFRTCEPLQVGTQGNCEAGVDEILGNDDDFIGAGNCIADVRNCFVNDGYSEGGDTLNGRGDPTNNFSNATYCIPASTSDSVNATSGLPGPGRIRQPVLVVPNFTTLP